MVLGGTRAGGGMEAAEAGAARDPGGTNGAGAEAAFAGATIGAGLCNGMALSAGAIIGACPAGGTANASFASIDISGFATGAVGADVARGA